MAAPMSTRSLFPLIRMRLRFVARKQPRHHLKRPSPRRLELLELLEVGAGDPRR